MPVIELDPGESYSFAAAPLRAAVSAVGSRGDVQLKVLREDTDAEEQRPGATRISPTELLVTPMPRRVRLEITPKAGGTFDSGTVVSVSLRTEGPAQTMEQIIVAPVDVSAFPTYTLAVLEFGRGTAELTVPSARAAGVGTGEAPATVVGGLREGLPPEDWTHGAAPPHDSHWLDSGRYAMRTAAQHHRLPSPPVAWALVVDGSASMRSYDGETGASLVELLSGIMTEWTGRSAAAAVYAGAMGPVEVAEAVRRPAALMDAFDGVEPGSCSTVAAGVRHVAQRMADKGAIVVLTDGVPGDVQELVAALEQSPELSCVVLTTGRSVWNLGGQRGVPMQSWQEELGGLGDFADGLGRGVVALNVVDDGAPAVGGEQAAELAAAVFGHLGGIGR